ncbi:MAG: hypothetical protein AMXMBFR81_22140 [Chthonomonas sp.]
MAATARLESSFEGHARVVLENSALRVEFDPFAGGAAIGMFDKRTGKAIARCKGLRVAAFGRPHAPALWTLDEELGAWSLLVVSGGIGLSATFTLHPTEPKIQVDATLHNRSLTEPMDTDIGLSWAEGGDLGACPGARWAHDPATGSGLGVLAEEDFAFRPESGGVWKHPVHWRLAPRQSLGFRCLWVAVAEMPRVDALTSRLALGVGEQLSLRVFAPLAQGRIDLMAGGQPMSAPCAAYPEHTLSLALPPGTERVAVVGEKRDVLAQWPAEPSHAVEGLTPALLPEWWRDVLDASRQGSASGAALRYGLSEAGLRGLAHALLGTEALRTDRPEEASRWFEGGLRFAGDDPLMWWALAFARRLAGLDQDNEDRWALVGAHEASPLEPMLRAEAYLSQPSNHREPSPLLAPLAAVPSLLASCAATLLETGQLEQTARFLDEALRHGEDPMLRCLLAATMLRSGRMTAQAAEHASRIGGLASLRPEGAVQRGAVQAVAEAFGP